MTVICQCCKTTISEKCPVCGGIGVDVSDYDKDEFWCDTCISYFACGEGGVSHGICEACYPKISSKQEDEGGR